MALKEMAIPEPPKLYTKQYANLGGVDYSCDVSEVAQSRTPTGTNMISDRGGNPVKRLGWRQIARSSTLTGKILKIIPYDRDDNTTPYPDLWVIATDGVAFYRHEEATSQSAYTETRLKGTDQKPITIDHCMTFTFNGSLYCFLSRIQTENAPLGLFKMSAVDGVPTFQNVSDDEYNNGEAYVPETTIGLAPNGTGGTSLEAVNLFTSKMTFSFCGDSTSTTYYLYPESLRTDTDKQKIEYNSLKVEVLNDSGKWVTMTKGTDYTVSGLLMSEHCLSLLGGTRTADICDAKITFASPHESTLQSDNVRITFKPFDMQIDHYEGSAPHPTPIYKGFKNLNAIDFMSATCCNLYGHTTADRVFVGGFRRCSADPDNTGREYKNRVYYSQVNDPTYFPDNNYLTVGHDDNYVMSLQKVGDYLAAVKSDSVLDSTLYLIRGSYLDDSMYFMVIPTSVSTGAIAQEASATLVDEPMYLSRTGIYAITPTSYRTEERTIRNRSGLINKRLLEESGLENACAIVWDRYYILCVNSHCYVLDGRKYSPDAKKNSDYQVEAYYWENVPATTFATYKNELYFGTADGRICKFNTDVPDPTRYCDDGIETILDPPILPPTPSGIYVWLFDPQTAKLVKVKQGEDTGNLILIPDYPVIISGTPVSCEWSTPLDDDGAPQLYKTLDKKGNVITLLALGGTSAKVKLVKDGTVLTSLNTYTTPVIDWVAASYSTEATRVADDFTRKKVKKYKRLQIIVQNDTVQPFGISKITKTYSYGNYAK